MSRNFSVATIVEGHGETFALPVLLRRLVPSIDPERWADVKRPIRMARSLLTRPDELERRIDLAARQVGTDGGAILLVCDADDDCAAILGPDLCRRVQACRSDVPSAVVIAVREFEAWYLASAESIAGRRGLEVQLRPPADPEGVRDAKRWLQNHRTDGLAYSPTVDQPALAEIFDMTLARARSRSFDRLWREIERLLEVTS